MEKKEPLTRAIILGRTRLELRAANSRVSWHSLAGHGEGEARRETERVEMDYKDSYYRYWCRCQCDRPWNRRGISVSKYSRRYYSSGILRVCRSRCKDEVAYSDVDFDRFDWRDVGRIYARIKKAYDAFNIYDYFYDMIISGIKL